MTYGTSATAEPGCNGDLACNFGYQAGVFAYDYAQSVGVNPQVTWWLDVEKDPSWTANTAENAQVVQGAINALRGFGINNVGIYASPDVWNQIVGAYQPPVPLWVAWWTGDGPSNCQNIKALAASQGDLLPTGPVFVTQYTDNGGTLDGDYAC
jgi:GH25 family lysozyme M1 (1,4-beta-N-acetylmuramidase)